MQQVKAASQAWQQSKRENPDSAQTQLLKAEYETLRSKGKPSQRTPTVKKPAAAAAAAMEEPPAALSAVQEQEDLLRNSSRPWLQTLTTTSAVAAHCVHGTISFPSLSSGPWYLDVMIRGPRELSLPWGYCFNDEHNPHYDGLLKVRLTFDDRYPAEPPVVGFVGTFS